MSSKYKSAETISDSDSEDSVTFKPPSSYKKMAFKKALPSLKDKEVWLMQVPSSLALGKVSKLPVTFNAESQPTFEVDGVEYSVAIDESQVAGRYRLLVPDTPNSLKVAPKEISQIYKISEQVSIPGIDISKAAVPKPVVEQKPNLYMRAYPTGYGKEDYDEARPNGASAVTVANGASAVTEASPKKGKKKEDKKDKKDKSKHKHDDERPKKKRKSTGERSG